MNIEYVNDGTIGNISTDNGRLDALAPSMQRRFHPVLLGFLAGLDIDCGGIQGANERLNRPQRIANPGTEIESCKKTRARKADT
jgi:hypothetical protein